MSMVAEDMVGGHQKMGKTIVTSSSIFRRMMAINDSGPRQRQSSGGGDANSLAHSSHDWLKEGKRC